MKRVVTLLLGFTTFITVFSCAAPGVYASHESAPVNPEEWLGESETPPLLPVPNVVEVTVSIPINEDYTEEELVIAMRSAVKDALKKLWFTPTLIVLTRATVKGDKLYLRVLFADEDGELMIEELTDDPGESKDKNEKIKI